MVARSLWRQGNRKLVACKLAAHTPGVWPDYLSQLHHWLASNSQSSDRSTGPATRIVLEEEVKRSSRPGDRLPGLEDSCPNWVQSPGSDGPQCGRQEYPARLQTSGTCQRSGSRRLCRCLRSRRADRRPVRSRRPGCWRRAVASYRCLGRDCRVYHDRRDRRRPGSRQWCTHRAQSRRPSRPRRR